MGGIPEGPDRKTGFWWISAICRPYLWQAAVAIEDERFFSHHGVDWKRTLGATVKTLVGSNDSYGGSTITQQMLKNMTGEKSEHH